MLSGTLLTMMKMTKMTIMNVKFTLPRTIIRMNNDHAVKDKDDRNDHDDHAVEDEDEDHPSRNRLRRNK